ncbi:MAG: acyl-CoA dehydrogenase family protein [Dehalococcoidia bacterium]|nr:acyl-CoA dehydrogenase family protein [Dehalococcoidia bacterium]
MDFRFTPQQLAWRDEVRAFLRAELPPDYDGGDTETEEGRQEIIRFHKKLAAKGWLVLAWPKEYGGSGLGLIEQLIFQEEYGYHRGPYVGPGVSFIGPALMMHGTEEQKKKHLTAIANADVRWCQGFSEPQTGSDLASLQTRAVEDGDDFIVNGTKIWTSFAHWADWCWLMARTNPDAPKHRGISMLMVDMKSPGITVRPIIDMGGRHHLNQVFFDDVRVPRANLVGPKDMGWYVATTTLDFERSIVGTSAQARRTLEELVAYCNETIGPDGQPIGKDPVIRAKLAQMATEIEVARLLAYQTVSVQLHGKVPNREGSLSKMYSTELTQRLLDVGLQILGPYAPLTAESKWAKLRGRLIQMRLFATSNTIAGGTSEIQRQIVATRGLGMPR